MMVHKKVGVLSWEIPQGQVTHTWHWYLKQEKYVERAGKPLTRVTKIASDNQRFLICITLLPLSKLLTFKNENNFNLVRIKKSWNSNKDETIFCNTMHQNNIQKNRHAFHIKQHVDLANNEKKCKAKTRVLRLWEQNKQYCIS